MNYSQVSNPILTIAGEDHELGLPELLVIRDAVVVGVSLTHLETGGVTFETKFQIF